MKGHNSAKRATGVWQRQGVAAAFAALCAWTAHAQPASVAARSDIDLSDLSIEQLANIVVTSVSRRDESLLRAAASAYVITADDIRRSGARSLPEALRLAPNLQVARVNAAQWSISARGFNNAIGNKLLVLVDGRTIYSPLFSGVFWDAQDVMLEDVDRIEVISGPGATLWGANAVNGVINVVTRASKDTQGALLGASGGGTDGQLAARFGGKLGQTGTFRVYGLGIEREHSHSASGAKLNDATRKKQAGWRADWDMGADGFTFQGDAYEGGERPGTPEAPKLDGANVLARWNRREVDGSSWQLQAYWDQSRRVEPFSFNDDMQVMDVEWQHSPALGQSHKLVWGAGYRQARDDTQATLLVRFIPQQKDLRWVNVFAQDEIALGDRWAVTLGSKLERNVYTGWEFLPNARLAWTPSPTRMAWASLSRAVRAPARLDREFFFPGAPPFFINGGPNFQSEVAKVAEIGWREQPTPHLSYSVTLFYDQYEKLRSGQPPPAVVQNMIEGHTSGVEAWGLWQVRDNWRLSAGFNQLHKSLHLLPGSTDPTGPSALGNDPRMQWQVRSSLNAGAHEFDTTVRHVGALPSPFVAAYTAVDLRWGWHVSRRTELSLLVQNLFDSAHVEYGAAPGAAEVQRAVWMKILWRM
ncbi:MAG TPA: TonB-dependent receptor [Ramlibacter sp.]|uniref:TonB-dependent receptor plug domain-containing protein n=1 Tax=Ramlibacter sp. TaxID=1917967 RepID=UPI002B839758|nr:TonB-dependent receptor [Ramlibacter sp.]HVZ45415.1 TonB-dependent receptor [Ramlibacter sp.]